LDENNFLKEEFFTCPIESRQTSIIRLELKADEFKFVSSTGQGRIISAEIKNFEAMSGSGS